MSKLVPFMLGQRVALRFVVRGLNHSRALFFLSTMF
jgi:hypothetical protein